ncbi:hypothetical protein IP510_13550, partial [Psychrobacter sp. NG254]|uniref:Ig-like domain-containing protein n=1 Tax=Psychrobacter sp. NG254 TaxID=2782003 RepID=UPI0019E56375
APVAVNDAKSGASGATVDVAVVGNDTDPENDIDPTSVLITQAPVGSTIAADGKSVVVDGEGTWTVNPATGNISFAPEAGFTADPTPISYTVKDINGLVSNAATVTIDYPQTAPVAVNDEKLDQVFGSNVTLEVLSNDTDPENDIDPTSVLITVSPAGGTIAADGKSVVVSGEGTWSINENTGAITFDPENGFVGNPTPISYTVKDINGLVSNAATVTIDYEQPTRIEVTPPGRVSEEGLVGGNLDDNPDSFDTTDSATDTEGNWVRVTDTDTNLDNAIVKFVLPATDNGITSQGNDVVFRIDSATGNIVGEYEYTDSNNITQTQTVLTIGFNGSKETITDGYQFGYDVTLSAPVDHTAGDNVEGILSVDFGIEVFENATATESLVKSDELLAIIEDDSPVPQALVWNIDVQQETITVTNLQTGFTNSLFTDPSRAVTVADPSYLIAGSLNTAAGSSGDTIPLRNYGGTVGILSAELDATYTAADGLPYVDTLDEAIYWGRPADATTSPAGYTTYENTIYQGTTGQQIKFGNDIDLGDFSHINFGVFGDGGTLLETELDINFNVTVNGNPQTVAVEYEMQHNETPNNLTAASYGLDSATYSDEFVQSDFIVIPNASRIIDIAGQQYRLDITLVNKDPDFTIDSDKNKAFLKVYQDNDGFDNNGDGLVDQSMYSVVGKAINGFANRNSNSINYYDLNNNNILGDEGDAQLVLNLDSGYRYTVIGNTGVAYIDADKNGRSDGIDFDGDNINDAVLDAAGNLDYVVFSTNGRRAEDTDSDGIIDKYDSNGDNIVDTGFSLTEYDSTLDEDTTFVVNSVEGGENTYDVIGKLTPLNAVPVLDNNVVIEGKVSVGGDAIDYLTSTSAGIVWSGVSTTDSDATITIVDTDGDSTNYEFQTDYGSFIGYADGSYKFKTVDNIADIVRAGVDDVDVFKFEFTDSDGDTANSTVTLNYNEYATPQSPDSINDIPSRTTDDNDYLVGTNQVETLSGGKGDDTLIGLSGADTLLGGDGSDIIIFDRNDARIDGGENSDGSRDNDTLAITDTTAVSSIDLSNVTNFETINMVNDTAQTLNLGLSDVISMTDSSNQLFIKGDSLDTVNISGMTKSATSDQAGYDLYQDSGNTASLYIQTVIDDNII